MNQLQHLVAKDHRARGRGKVLTHLERAFINLAGHSAIVPQIIEQMMHALHSAVSARFQQSFQRLWIEYAVAGGQRIGEQG